MEPKYWRSFITENASGDLQKLGIDVLYLESTIGSGIASQATPQGQRHKSAEVGFEITIKRVPARSLDHRAAISPLWYDIPFNPHDCWRCSA